MSDTEPRYYGKFGHFVNQFANVEAIVHFFCWRTIGIPDDQGRVITGGMRLHDVIEITKRLARAKKLPAETQQNITRLFSQLSLISSLRDRLIHRGVNISGDDIVSSNERTARFKEDIEILRLSVRDIEAASLDLAYIFIQFLGLARPRLMGRKLSSELAQEPWLYKPRQPETPHRPPRKARRSRGRRRGASVP